MKENAAASSKPAWQDPDDAPPLGDAFFKHAQRTINGQPVTPEAFKAAVRKHMGRPPLAHKRPTLNMRIDADVLEALRASGKGWQTRVNAILRREILGE